MTTASGHTYLRSVAFGLTATLGLAAGACAKKSDSSSAPAPAPETTTVADSKTGNHVAIAYSSNDKDAKFLCTLEIDGKASGSPWQSCPPSIDMNSGSSYVLRAKAVSTGGVEDATPVVKVWVAAAAAPQGGPNPLPPSPTPQPLVTQILAKSTIGSVYAQSSLTLQLGITGTSSLDNISFLCRRNDKGETTYQLCKGPTPNSYDFGALLNGEKVSLDVQARTLDGTQAQSDNVSFTVQLTPFIVTGSDQLAQAKGGTVNLTWAPAQLQGGAISCQLDNQVMVAAQGTCANTGGTVDVGILAPGAHMLTVAALAADGRVLATTNINFCTQQCSGVSGGTPVPIVQAYQIGSFYQYIVPPTMHVTEYATTKTVNNSLVFYRVTPDSDPSYLGNYSCSGAFDRRITGTAPSAQSFDYCMTTPAGFLGSPNDFYKWLTNGNLAYNHLQVATNPDKVNPENHTYISMNMFDSTVEFMYGRSMFQQLCANKIGDLYQSPSIRFMNRNFWGESVKAQFLMCTTDLVVPNGPGLPTRDPVLWRNTWWVGTFFITSKSLTLPQFECFDDNYWLTNPTDTKAHSYQHTGSYSTDPTGSHSYVPSFCGSFQNASMLEVTVISKTPYPAPEFFAADAQQMFENNLQQAMPVK